VPETAFTYFARLDLRTLTVALRAPDALRVPARFLPDARLRAAAVALALLRVAPDPSGRSCGSGGSASLAVSAIFDIRFVVPFTWRCSDPMTRPSDSADRTSSESSSVDLTGFRAGTIFVRLAISQAPPLRVAAPLCV